MIAPYDVQAIARLARSYQEQKQAHPTLGQVAPKSAPIVTEYEVNLATLAGTGLNDGSVAPVPLGGEELVCLHNGSTPGGRCLVSLDGRKPIPVYPGVRLKGPFQNVAFSWDRRSTWAGTLMFAATEVPGAIVEPEASPTAAPVYLLGSFNTFVQQQGSPGATPDITNDTWFAVNGWRKLRVFMQAVMSSGTFTGCDLVPWVYVGDEADGVLFENGPGAISLPDSAPSGHTNRVFLLDLEPIIGPLADSFTRSSMLLLLQPRNYPATMNVVKFIVQGVE